MKIIDISMPIHFDMQVYKNRNNKRPRFTTTRDFVNGTGEKQK